MHSDYTWQAADLTEFIKVILKRKWVVISFFVIVVSIVTIASFKQIPIYRATTRLLIEKEDPNVLTFKDVLSIDGREQDYYKTQHQILKSRSLAKRVLRDLDLQQIPRTRSWNFSMLSIPLRTVMGNLTALLPGTGPGQEDVSLRERADPVDALLGCIRIEPVPNTRLVDVNVESEDPQLCAEIANSLAKNYIEQSLEIKLAASLDAVKWLSERVKDLKTKVEESEMALQRYKEGNQMVSLEDRQNIVVQKLAQLNSMVTEAKTKRVQAELRYEQLRRLRGEQDMGESLPSVVDNLLIQKLKAAYAQKEAELSEFTRRYREKHPVILRLRSELETLRARILTEIDKIVQSEESQYWIAKSHEQQLRKLLEEQRKVALELNQKAIEYEVLRREAKTNQDIYESVTKRMKEASLTGGLRASNVRVVDEAEVPATSVRPRKRLNVALSAVFSLLLGCGLAICLERMDNTIRTQEDIEQYLELPFLGYIPSIKSRGKERKEVALYAYRDPKSAASEAFRSVRTGMVFTTPWGQLKSVLITSAGSMEGKTTVAVNLAISLAQGGANILLVDTDMRRPSIHKVFDFGNDSGMSNYLVGKAGFEFITQETFIENLSVTFCGPIPPNPAELLGSSRMEEFVKEAEAKFDMILFDSPPLVAVTDAVILANRVDGVIHVIESGRVNREIVNRARQKLQEAGARIIGTALNNVDVRRNGYYSSYYYYYNYSEDTGKREEKRKALSKT